MNELLKPNYENDRITFSARELHKYLDVKTEFRHWFPRMTEYGFSEEIDFSPVIFDHPQNHQPIKDYQLTIDMAKEIAMLQRNEKGKQARRYFLEIEKAWNSPEKIMARALSIAKDQINSLTIENTELKPKALFADAVATSKQSILVGELAKIMKQNGIDIGRDRLFIWLRQNGYLGKSGEEYNNPTQKSMDLEIMEIKKSTITNRDGSVRTTRTPKITGKGQIYFINKFITKEQKNHQ